jgi:hypothetical protein
MIAARDALVADVPRGSRGTSRCHVPPGKRTIPPLRMTVDGTLRSPWLYAYSPVLHAVLFAYAGDIHKAGRQSGGGSTPNHPDERARSLRLLWPLGLALPPGATCRVGARLWRRSGSGAQGASVAGMEAGSLIAQDELERIRTLASEWSADDGCPHPASMRVVATTMNAAVKIVSGRESRPSLTMRPIWSSLKETSCKRLWTAAHGRCPQANGPA